MRKEERDLTNGFTADSRLSKLHVFDDVLVQVVADHQHVEVLIDRVDRVWHGRVGRGRKHVGLRADGHNVRGVAAAGALAVVGVDGASLHCRDGIGDVARFVQRVRMDCDRAVIVVRKRQRCANKRSALERSNPIPLDLR